MLYYCIIIANCSISCITVFTVLSKAPAIIYILCYITALSSLTAVFLALQYLQYFLRFQLLYIMLYYCIIIANCCISCITVFTVCIAKGPSYYIVFYNIVLSSLTAVFLALQYLQYFLRFQLLYIYYVILLYYNL